MQSLKDSGLGDIDIEGCAVTEEWRQNLVNLILSYEDVFSRGKLDCGEAKGFVHCIRLSDSGYPTLVYRLLINTSCEKFYLKWR